MFCPLKDVFNLPKFSHVTHLCSNFHWLPVAAHNQFNTMMLALKAVKDCTRVPPNTGQTTHPSTTTSLYYISWPAGTAIT